MARLTEEELLLCLLLICPDAAKKKRGGIHSPHYFVSTGTGPVPAHLCKNESLPGWKGISDRDDSDS